MAKATLNLHSDWVNTTLQSLSLEQKIGQILHPFINPKENVAAQLNAFNNVEPGGIFLFSGSSEEFKTTTTAIQDKYTVPVVISSDLESGAGRMIDGGTVYPDLMGVGATNDTHLSKEMGKATAIEGLEHGVHWTFGPMVDINEHPGNPIVNTRGIGDRLELIEKISCAIIDGMQEHGMAACAKHFPGDGFDDRDQHICTTINPLTKEDWFRASGKMFQSAIDAGTLTIMIGHIALPWCDAGAGDSILDAPPATISKKQTTDLLRGELGFEGLIVSDAIDMGGLKGRYTPEEYILDSFLAGCDMILFSEINRDFPILLNAYNEGKISDEHLDLSVRRILALKEILNLPTDAAPRPNTIDKNQFKLDAQQMAEKAITLVQDTHNLLPLTLDATKKVLIYHLRADDEYAIDQFDDIVRSTGAQVTRKTEVELQQWCDPKAIAEYDIILNCVIYGPNWSTGLIRPSGRIMRNQLNQHPCNILISFGTPYVHYDMPWFRTVINAYSLGVPTQEAVLKILTGKLEPRGLSPVDLDRPYKMKLNYKPFC